MNLITLALSAIFLLNTSENNNNTLSMQFNAQTIQFWEAQPQNIQYMIAGQVVKYLPVTHIWNLINIFDKKYVTFDHQLKHNLDNKIKYLVKSFLNKDCNKYKEALMVFNSHNAAYEDFFMRALDRLVFLYCPYGSYALKTAELSAKNLSLKSQQLLIEHIDRFWPKDPMPFGEDGWVQYENNSCCEIELTTLLEESLIKDKTLFSIISEKERVKKMIYITDSNVLNNCYINEHILSKTELDIDGFVFKTTLPRSIKAMDALWIGLCSFFMLPLYHFPYSAEKIKIDSSYYFVTEPEATLFRWPTKKIGKKTKKQIIFRNRVLIANF